MKRDNELLASALDYAGRGWLVHPLKPGDKKPLTKWEGEATKDAKKIRQWWDKWPNANIGLVCGAASDGALCIDFDKPGAFEAWASRVGDVVQSCVVQTTGGGCHVIFRCDNPGQNQKLAYTEAGETMIETRANGGYIMAAPSIHPNGKTYTVTQGKLTAIPRLKIPEVVKLLSAARSLDKKPKPQDVNPFADLVRNSEDIAATQAQPVSWQTKGFIERGELVLITAPGGSMKSLLMLDWAVCVAAGHAWLTPPSGAGGLRCFQDGVLWVNTDNSEYTHANRLRAIMQARGLNKIPLFSMTITDFELSKPEHIKTLAALVADLGAQVVVFDTLSGALTGIDENAAQQMTLPAAHLRALADTGLTVVAIHHPPKNDVNGARGSSVLAAKVDRFYTITREGDAMSVKPQKVRNTPPVQNISPLAAIEIDPGTEALLAVRFWDGQAALLKRADDVLKEKIRNTLSAFGEMTLNKLTDAVKCRQPDLKRVLFELRRDGVVSETDGPRNSKIYKLEN